MAARAMKYAAVLTIVAMSLVQAAVTAAPSGAAAACTSVANAANCVVGLLNAPSAGAYLKQVGGKVLSSVNGDVAYEPASSIKPLIAYYAMKQVQSGKAQLTDQVSMIDTSAGPDDCPTQSLAGTEPLHDALSNMMRYSDNNRTEELMQHFGVDKLNAFAASLKLTHTHFQTKAAAPGFNVIGCISFGNDPLPSTVDGNTMSLADASTMWTDIDKLPAPYQQTFYQLAAGRPMFNIFSNDFTGYWPTLESIAQSAAPAGMSANQINSFISHMTVDVKSGGYVVIDNNNQWAQWYIFAGIAQIPSCAGTKVKETKYTWGYFISDLVSSGGQNTTGLDAANGQILAPLISQGIANWSQCAPAVTPGVVITTPKALTLKAGRDPGPNTALVKFTDPDKTDIAADFFAVIDWGDNVGAITFDAAIFGKGGHSKVSAPHQYPVPGVYTANVSVLEELSQTFSTVPVTITVK